MLILPQIACRTLLNEWCLEAGTSAQREFHRTSHALFSAANIGSFSDFSKK